jgi:hypothetical protein
VDTGPRHRAWMNTMTHTAKDRHATSAHAITPESAPPTLLPHTLHNVHAPGLASRRLQLLPHLRQGHPRQAVEVGRLQLPPQPQGSPSPAPAQHTSHSPGAMLEAVSTHAHHSKQCTQTAALCPRGATHQLSLQLSDGALSLQCPGCLCFLHAHTPYRHDGGLVVTRTLNPGHTNFQPGLGHAHGNRVLR